EEIIKKIYLNQRELSERWDVSPGTIIKWRNEGRIPFFRLPGASRVLYPVDQILKCEQEHTTTIKEEGREQKQHTELKRKKPVVSAKPHKEWRI
ncbi:MAG: helix-turn-helix domain-containing protein, partial [Desulfoprunum sp.]|uniref:helix-turn-helix domain-containing protein n=1 Tax=Desulfoprunum sp. TaxID=2020866 RepID=UPI003C723604